MREPNCQVADWFKDIPVPTYLVRLIDCTDSIGASDQSAVTAQLTTWFTQADSTRKGVRSSVRVEWAHSVPSTTFANLVINFVTNRSSSVIRHMKHFASPTHWGNLTGYTNMYDYVQPAHGHGAARTPAQSEHLSGCEVYTSKCANAAITAMFAFHEAMHNQLHMGDEMHRLGGIAAAVLTPGTTPSPANLAAYGAAMGTIRPQWIDGYARAHPAKATHALHPHH